MSMYEDTIRLTTRSLRTNMVLVGSLISDKVDLILLVIVNVCWG